jgi:hypothetical protein
MLEGYMKASALEIRRVEALENFAKFMDLIDAKLVAINGKLDNLEHELLLQRKTADSGSSASGQTPPPLRLRSTEAKYGKSG